MSRSLKFLKASDAGIWYRAARSARIRHSVDFITLFYLFRFEFEGFSKQGAQK